MTIQDDLAAPIFFTAPEESLSAGIPACVVRFVVGIGRLRDIQLKERKDKEADIRILQDPRVMPKGPFEDIRDRIERLTEFWRMDKDKESHVRNAWATLERVAYSSENLVDLFVDMPDGPINPSFSSLTLLCPIDLGEQRDRYRKLLNNIDSIVRFFSDSSSKSLEPRPYIKSNISEISSARRAISPKWQRLMKSLENKKRDGISKKYFELKQFAMATDEASIVAYEDFESARNEFFDGLNKFRRLVEIVDPSANTLTKHWKADDVKNKQYFAQLASLNRFLRKPQHAAIATIAMANNTGILVHRDIIRKYWSRSQSTG